MMERYFDDMNPSEGHLERFLDKFDNREAGTAERKRIQFHRRERRKLPFWRIVSLPAAAAAILVVLMNILTKMIPENNYFENENTCEAVYIKYNELIADAMTVICEKTAVMDESLASEILTVFNQISEDPVPFIEQLPEELSEELKTEYSKDYYSHKLQAIKEINNYKNLRK